MNTLDLADDWRVRIAASDVPLHQALLEVIAEDIAQGQLAPGDRLPSQRELADALGMGLSTVVRAFRVGAREGLISGTVGRGTFVGGGTASAAALGPPDYDGEVDLAVDLGFPGLEPDPGPVLADLAAAESRWPLLRNQPHLGAPGHRAAGARWLARHELDVAAEHVAVCAGTQHGLLCSLMTCAAHGDRVLCDALTYPGLRAAARHLGVQLEGVEAGDGGDLGLDPSALDRAARRSGARAVVLMPSLHNPLSTAMDLARREAVVAVAERHDLTIIEDETHRHAADAPAAPFAALAPHRTIHLAGLSKCLASGLRIGFIAAPSDLLGALQDAVWGTAWMAAPLMAEVTTRWIDDGTADATIRAKRLEATARIAALNETLGPVPGATIRSATAGHSAWVTLPRGWTASALVAAAAARGVRLGRTHAFSVAPGPPPPALRITVSAAPDRPRLQHGLDVVAELLRDRPPAP